MKKLHFFTLLAIALIVTNGCKENKNEKNVKTLDVKKIEEKTSKVYKTELLVNLPEQFNSPASGDVDADGNLYFTSPNLHNAALIKEGAMTIPAMPSIGKVDGNNQLSTWYTFKSEDLDKKSGVVVPFGFVFGPDGNAYVGDMQLWAGGTSRILRFVIENNNPVRVETVLMGTSFINGMVWKGNDLFITDTVLGETKDGKQISGVYKVNLLELNADKPLQIKPFKSLDDYDTHLFETFISNGSLKFGANGIAIDGEGSLYTGIMEEGTILKTTMDSDNNKIKTMPFAKGMITNDGIKWDAKTNKLYSTDLFANAVYSIDMDGNLHLIAENGDTDGQGGKLDAPSEVVIRGNDVIVMNFDAVFNNPQMKNTKADKPYTLSIFSLE